MIYDIETRVKLNNYQLLKIIVCHNYVEVDWSSATRTEAHSIVYSCRTVHSNDHIIESATLPDELVRDAGGQIAFQESSVRVNYNLHDV